MSIIKFKESNCKNCYKCIRECELKAIKFIDEQAHIIEDNCILCGKCTLICPQNAKQLKSDLNLVKSFLKNNIKVFVSLAPSYVAAFPGASFSQISSALKKLGFIGVEETAIGAKQVSIEYASLIKEKKMDNIITSCCPSTVMLIEKYYPELVKDLAPVVSPAIAHGKMLKEMYGNRNKVVFIGPCISKMHEVKKNTSINAVLIFDELREWFEEEGIEIGEEDSDVSEMHETTSRFYPLPGGIIKSLPNKSIKEYKTLSIDGLGRCIKILDSIRDDGIKGYFIEMNMCIGSCIEGPGMHNFKSPFLISKDAIIDNVKKRTATPIPITENSKVPLGTKYKHLKSKDDIPDEKTIESILYLMGKKGPEFMYNCGTCGYYTCREKAIAVYQGRADIKMCLSYMREKSESMSNLVVENIPYSVFVTDSNFNVLEYNVAAENLFKINAKETIGNSIKNLLVAEEFNKQLELGHSVYNIQGRGIKEDMQLNLSIVSMPKCNYMILVENVTDKLKESEELDRARKETIERAQKAVERQMRVAQEIASILGETTGETKAILSKLKRM